MVCTLRATLDEEAIKAVKDEIQQFVGQNEGAVESFNDLGSKKLAYEVEGEQEGYFVQVFFNMNPALLEGFLGEVKAHDSVIRIMVTTKSFVSSGSD